MAAEVKPLLTVGDKTLAYELTDRLSKHEYFRGRSESAIYQTVCYYLRSDASPVKPKPRAQYSAKQLENLMVMSLAERTEWAKKHGKSVRAVDSVLSRHRAKMERRVALTVDYTPYTKAIEKNGYMNISSAADLKAMGYSPNAVRAVRRYLHSELGLGLRTPNLLYHARTKRVYAMALVEQTALFDNPQKYLRLYADKIKAGWVDQADPMDAADAEGEDLTQNHAGISQRPYAGRYDGYPVYGDDGGVDMTQPRQQISKQGKRLLRAVETLEEMLKKPVQQGSFMFGVVTRLGDLAGEVVKSVTPPFDPKDPTTYVDDTKETQDAAGQEDEDAWMKDWKPKSAE
jgi:hypothetical protein